MIPVKSIALSPLRNLLLSRLLIGSIQRRLLFEFVDINTIFSGLNTNRIETCLLTVSSLALGLLYYFQFRNSFLQSEHKIKLLLPPELAGLDNSINSFFFLFFLIIAKNVQPAV